MNETFQITKNPMDFLSFYWPFGSFFYLNKLTPRHSCVVNQISEPAACAHTCFLEKIVRNDSSSIAQNYGGMEMKKLLTVIQFKFVLDILLKKRADLPENIHFGTEKVFMKINAVSLSYTYEENE